MTVSPEVQTQIDKTRELTDIVASVESAMKALRTHVDEIESKAQAIPVAAPAAQGAPAQSGMSEEDKAALIQTVQDTQSIINQLKSDITANTPVDVSATPVDMNNNPPVQPVAPGTDPSTVQPPALVQSAEPAAPATQATAPPPQPTNPNA